MRGVLVWGRLLFNAAAENDVYIDFIVCLRLTIILCVFKIFNSYIYLYHLG